MRIAVASDHGMAAGGRGQHRSGRRPLPQGAYLREYHGWEKDTKQYCDDQLDWHRQAPFRWKAEEGSHVEKVRRALITLGAEIPDELLGGIDRLRQRVNPMKHSTGWSEDDFILHADYEAAVASIQAFWDALAGQEQFHPPPPRLRR
jgi:hypothetical protein